VRKLIARRRSDRIHKQTKKIEFDIRGWCRSECIEFHLCSIGWRPLSIADSSLDFVDEPNDNGAGGPGTATTVAMKRILHAHLKLKTKLLRYFTGFASLILNFRR
jgi:hypothetical protein